MFSTIFDMSKWIVSQRPFSRKKHKQSFKKVMNRSGIAIPEIKISQKLKHILSRWMCFILIIIIGIMILIKALFFKPEQKIINVKFSEDTLATYQDIELFNTISNEVKWKNYFILLSHKDELLSNIQKKFPFVWDIEIQLEKEIQNIEKDPQIITIWTHLPLELPITGQQHIQTVFPLKESKLDEKWWTLWIQILYYDPKVLVKLNGKIYAVRDENTYVELKEWMLLWIRDPEEEPLFTIETPQYLNWTNNLNWFFFEIGLEKIMKIISLAKEEFWNDMIRFVYLAWSTRFAIFTSDQKTLYFNFPDLIDVEEQRTNQIIKYNTLKEKYQRFEKIEKIDLWALEENKTIITNY